MEPKPISNSFNTQANGDTPDTPDRKANDNTNRAAETAAVIVTEGALLAAAKANKIDEARALLQAGAKVNEVNSSNETALVLSLAHYSPPLTRLFLHFGADVARFEEQQGKSLLSLLRHADSNFHAEEEPLACLLLDHGAAADVKDNHGLPLISRYASLGMLQAVERVLEAGANPNAAGENNRCSALYYALTNNKQTVSIIEALLKAGANPDGVEGETTPPLYTAVNNKNHAAAEALLKAGANPDHAHTYTPLYAALKNNDTHMAQTLVAHGANPEQAMTGGLRALDMLVQSNAAADVIETALTLGFKADTCRLDEHAAPVETALHLAVRHNRMDMINQMLKHGADPLCVDGFGYTPLQLAHSLHGNENPIVDRLRLADGAARVERERAIRAAAVDQPPAGNVPPTHRPPPKP